MSTNALSSRSLSHNNPVMIPGIAGAPVSPTNDIDSPHNDRDLKTTRLSNVLSSSTIRGADSFASDDLSWFNPRILKSKARYNSLAQLATLDVMNTDSSASQIRKTSIICTIGPKTNSVESLIKLRQAGMNVMRLNFSHGSYEYHGSVIENLRNSFDVFPGPPVAIALDTKGPEIRTGNMRNGDVKLLAGASVTITVDPAFYDLCDEEQIYMDYENLPNIIERGSLIYIDDGLIMLEVEETSPESRHLQCRVLNDGLLSGRKGVNLPGTNVDLPAVSEKDRNDLAWGVEQGIDYVFASFVRTEEGIYEIRKALGENGKRVQIIAKIENQQGIENFDEILRATDGVMVARGDMGIEIPAPKVFLAQKMIIAKCNILGKPVICATQMLESMTTNPRPTRAEVSDVANAVMDGADCVMLSGETAKGNYPFEAVAMMANICKEAESAVSSNQHYRAIADIHPDMYLTSDTVAASAVNAAFTRNLKAIIIFSMSGRTARLASKYRPSCPIICVTTDPITARQASLARGVYPVCVQESFDENTMTWLEYTELQLQTAVEFCKSGDTPMLSTGDLCVVVQGWAGGSGHSNTMRLVTV